MASSSSASYHPRTIVRHAHILDTASSICRHAAHRLPNVHTPEDAIASLRIDGSAMLIFWHVACRMRQPRRQTDPQDLLTNLLSAAPSQVAVSVLRDALAQLRLWREALHPRAKLSEAPGSTFRTMHALRSSVYLCNPRAADMADCIWPRLRPNVIGRVCGQL